MEENAPHIVIRASGVVSMAPSMCMNTRWVHRRYHVAWVQEDEDPRWIGIAYVNNDC